MATLKCMPTLGIGLFYISDRAVFSNMMPSAQMAEGQKNLKPVLCSPNKIECEANMYRKA